MFELIDEARAMLLDRQQCERDLIYAIAKMDPELRGAIILAYEFLLKEKQDGKSLNQNGREF